MCVYAFLCFLFVFWVFVAQSFWFLFVFVEVWKIERVVWVKIGGMWWRHRTKKKEKEKKDPTMASFAEAPAGDVAKGTLSCLREGVRAIWLRGRARVADKISSLY